MLQYIYCQLITRLQAMSSLLGDVSDDFGDDGVVMYDCMSELVANKNGQVFIDTGDEIWVSEFSLSLGGTLNNTINLFVSNGRRMMSHIY